MTARLVEQSPDAGGPATSSGPSWTKRILLGTIGTAGATVALAAFATAAFANAANPLPDSHGTITPLAGGAVRVDVGGTWNWGAISGSSTQSDCDKRYGVGWAVDWWGLNNTPGTPIAGLTGSVAIATQNPPTLAEQSLAPNVTITNGGTTFHASTLLNGFDPNLCAHTDAQGFPEGPWSAYAIYPNEQSVPDKLCVNMYDLHGEPGAPKLGDFTSTNGDNSIKTNDFDPAANAGYCFTPVFQHPVSITVDKTNDANENGTFNKSETANSPDQDVDFKVVITNTSQQAVAVIDGPITDAFPGQTINVCNGNNGTNVIGTELNPGASVTCTFTVNNYAPVLNGADKVNTVTVNAHEKGLAGNSTGPVQSSSTVKAATGSPNVTVAKSGPAKGDLNGNGTYTITATNNGNAASTATTFTDTLPAGEQFVAAGSSNACSAAGQTVTCSLGALAAGAHEDFTVVVKYTQTGNLTDCATINGQAVPSCVTTDVGEPKLKVVKDGPAQGDLNGNGTYSLVVTNTGNRDATATTFTDTLPAGEQFVAAGSSNACTANGQVVTCSVNALAAGASQSFTVVVKYTQTGNLTDCATINGQAVPSCVTTEVGEPKLKVVKDGPAKGDLNGNGTYSLVVTNTGNRASTATTFTDTLPAGEQFVAAGSSPACSAVGQVVTCSVNALAAGASQSFTVVVKYTQTGNLTDCATIDGQAVPSCVTTEVGEPKLKVVKDGPAQGDLNGNGTYSLVVTNTGNRASTATTFTDTLPAGEQFVAAGSSAACSAVGQVVTCSVGALAAGASQSFTVVVKYTQTGNLTDCATIDGQAVPSCVTTDVGEPKLQVVKDGPAQGDLNGNGTYTMTVTNTGNRGSAATTFTDTLPAGETFVAAGSSAACSAVGQVVTCSVGALAAGAHATFTVVVKYTATGNLTDCATIAGQANPSCVTTNVGEPKLQVVKDGPATGTLGGNGTYTMTVTNNGNRTSTATTFTDTLPAGETFVAAGSSAACSAVGQIVTCSVGALAAGAHATFTVVVSYSKTGLLTDCATIAGQANPSCVTTRIPGEPALTVVKTNDADGDGIFHDDETAGAEGQDVTFKVVVTNTSAVAVVIDSVKDVFGAVSVNQCANLLGTVLAPGASVTCTFTIENYAPAAGSSLLDTVTVVGHEDGVPGNGTSGSDTSNVRTANPPDLAIVKSADQTSVTVGDILTYTLAVTNEGDGPTTGTITVTDSIPSGLDLISVDGGASWDCTVSGRDFTCVYLGGALAAGQSAPDITVVTRVNSTAELRVINTGVVDTPGDVNPNNDRSTVETPVTTVLPERIPRTPPPTEVLPFTGTDATSMLPVGLLMVLLGGALLMAGRRRRSRLG